MRVALVGVACPEQEATENTVYTHRVRTKIRYHLFSVIFDSRVFCHAFVFCCTSSSSAYIVHISQWGRQYLISRPHCISVCKWVRFVQVTDLSSVLEAVSGVTSAIPTWWAWTHIGHRSTGAGWVCRMVLLSDFRTFSSRF